MNITVPYTFEESYLPTTRHRKLRWREVEKEFVVTIKEISTKDAPVAFIVTEPHLYAPIEYRWFDNELWVPENYRDLYRSRKYHSKEGCANSSSSDIDTDDGNVTIYCASCDEAHQTACSHENRGFFHKSAELIKCMQRCPSSCQKVKRNEQAIINSILDGAATHILIDGIMYTNIGEPRYVLMTFGLGRNHGGTSLSIDNRYNVNIGKNRYYNAFDRERAIADTIATAKGRGDNESVGRIGCKTIEVLMPEAVKCNPQEEHGDGCEFQNDLNAITQIASNNAEAGLLATALALSEMNKENSA